MAGHNPNATPPGLRAAQARSDVVDGLLRPLADALADSSRDVAVVALGAYGRRELTPHTEVELLVLHAADLTLAEVVAHLRRRPSLRIDTRVRTVDQCEADARRSFAVACSLFDARLVAGAAHLFARLRQRAIEPLRRDRERLRRRLATVVQHRHATYPAATSSPAPDLLDGRGGLRDLEALRWLDQDLDARTVAALDFLLSAISALDTESGPHLLAQVYDHARWVAFRLDGALAAPRPDRPLGASLHLRDGRLELAGDRLPSLEQVPSLGLRVANLAGFAPPDAALLEWAATPGPPVAWDAAALEQLWLLLRAADWRAWEFLDVTGLLARYLPELASLRGRRPEAAPAADDLVLDTHSFLAVRRLHEWVDSSDPLARRVWPTIRHRDWVYLAVLLHELDVEAVGRLVERLGLPAEARAAVVSLVEHAALLPDTATRRDLHDEDLLLDMATRIGSAQRLGGLVLVAVAHDRALGGRAWTAWKADLLRQLYAVLDAMLRRPGDEIGRRRRRSIEDRRRRVAEALARRNQSDLLPLVSRLPRRYLLARSPAFVARHLALAGLAPLGEGEVRIEARRHRQPGVWDVLVVARDRPGLLATLAGVLTLRGASVLAADAATSSDGLVLDVFTVGSAYGAPLEASVWPRVAADLRAALAGRLPLGDLLATPSEPLDPRAVRVSVDNAASQVFSLVEVRAPDQAGLLYRIARALHGLGLDVHHAKIATLASGALDVFYVWEAGGEKLDPQTAARVVQTVTAALVGA